jgi:CubicO group peptidase (beta-lactamase class C family)
VGKTALGLLVAAWTLLASPAFADPARTAAFAAAVQPFVDSGEFCGAILVTRDGNVVFDQAYGFADTAHKNPNRTTTSFHIGTLSAKYTAAAIMILVDKQRLWLTNTAGQFLPDAAASDKTATIADLLARDPRADPAAWRTLARIAEIVSAKSFDEVLDTDFFGPLFMTGSGLDDGTLAPSKRMAEGNTTARPAWADLQGSGSAYTTTRDELRWIDALFGDKLLSAASRAALLQYWARANPVPPGGPAYAGFGAAPGFASFMLHAPAQDVTVIVLSNSKASDAAVHVGDALAALALGTPAP